MDNCIHYVYVYYDTRPGKCGVPIYVGLVKKNRAYVHLKYKCENEILNRKINKHRACNIEPDVVLYKQGLSFESAVALEIELIAKFGRLNVGTGTLCNLTDGGEGLLGYVQSDEQRMINSIKNSGTYEERYGKATAERLRKQRAEKLKGNTYWQNLSAEGRARISESSKRPKSKQHKQNMSAKFVVIDPDGVSHTCIGHAELQQLGMQVGFKQHTFSTMIWQKHTTYRGYTVKKV